MKKLKKITIPKPCDNLFAVKNSSLNFLKILFVRRLGLSKIIMLRIWKQINSATNKPDTFTTIPE